MLLGGFLNCILQQSFPPDLFAEAAQTFLFQQRQSNTYVYIYIYRECIDV